MVILYKLRINHLIITSCKLFIDKLLFLLLFFMIVYQQNSRRLFLKINLQIKIIKKLQIKIYNFLLINTLLSSFIILSNNNSQMESNSTVTAAFQNITPSDDLLSFTMSYTTLALLLGSFILYMIYYCHFREAQFIIKPEYDIKKKKIGKPLPPYPNGWYVALHSNQLKNGQSKPCDIAGENIVLFRGDNGVVHALHAYCAHMGAHLGIGGKVVNKQCIQCPFHGWLYDGETGTCVDHNGKPLQMRTAQYTQGFCKDGAKLKWSEGQQDSVSLRKFPIQQTNGYIYVWIHSMKQHQTKPQYSNISIQKMTKNLQFRGKTVHHIMCHIQDIPQNGSDILHFKYVHTNILPKLDMLSFSWKAKWMKGDDPELKDMFQHQKGYIREFKQQIYKDYVLPFEKKQFLSVGYIDNYLKMPFGLQCFMFNATIVQYGPATVFIFLRSPLYKVAFQQFIQPQDKSYQIIYHEMYTNSYIPYWLSALALKLEGDQVTNDMRLWESKKFASKLYYRKGMQYDDYLQKWREWYSRNYEGCTLQLKKEEDYSW